MIKYRRTIDNINEYQCGELPLNAQKLEAPTTMEEMMKKSTPIAIVLLLVMVWAMFFKTYVNKSMVVFLPAVVVGMVFGFLLLIVHEWLHAIVYPKQAVVTIGKLKGKVLFVALASFPLKRSRFITMSLLPFLLGVIPLILFLLSSPDNKILNGILFGMTGIGMISPCPDMYNVFLVLKQAKKNDKIMFYGDDMYKISQHQKL
ncbi:MAG: DUF3267 domain-containing protein [Oscillospiraceae bacterium]|nr:DUF3267 domain-containing protein [Oscillospiraceae bacterium]